MKWERVRLGGFGYELGPVVVRSDELEARVASVYERLHIPLGQLEALTGIAERRWWRPGTPISEGAVAAGRKALRRAKLAASELGAVIYGGVCRDGKEPATACRIAHELGVAGDAIIHDVSNACLGVLNGIVDLANRIELGQIRHGLVVSCESSREIMDTMIRRMESDGDIERFKLSLATLTGGSGAVGVVVSAEDGAEDARPRLLGGVARAAPEHHELCRWGTEPAGEDLLRPVMSTDAVGVLKHGVTLGIETWRALLDELGWAPGDVDRVVCHQVGSGHQDAILKALELEPGKDFTTFRHLGNMGTAALPVTLAMAAERRVVKAGDRVGLLGIGSGLNCLMLGVQW